MISRLIKYLFNKIGNSTHAQGPRHIKIIETSPIRQQVRVRTLQNLKHIIQAVHDNERNHY